MRPSRASPRFCLLPAPSLPRRRKSVRRSRRLKLCVGQVVPARHKAAIAQAVTRTLVSKPS